ncbi:hypothetical protein Tco_0449477 [Tanacetum coccineum]
MVWMRNKESKKVQRTLLKQQYKNFSGSSSETIDQNFDRLQKLISQLEIQGEPNSPQLELEDLENKITPDDIEEMDFYIGIMTMLTLELGDSSRGHAGRLRYNAASPAIESFVNSSEMLENQEYNKFKYDKGYHAVPPPFTGNLIPCKPNLMFMDEIVESENMDVSIVVTSSDVKKVVSNHESADVKNKGVEPKTVRKNSFIPPIIEDWNSDDESKVDYIPNVEDKTVRPSTKKILNLLSC